MILLISAIVAYILIYICFKLIDVFKIDNTVSILWNYLVASFTGFLVFGVDFQALIASTWLPIAIVVGLIFYGVFHLFAICSQKISITMTAMSSKMSVIIPVTASLIIFSEMLTTVKIIGIVLTLLSLFLILKPDRNNPIDKKYRIVPILIFIFTGISDTLIKYAQSSHGITDSIDSARFVSTLFGISFLVALLAVPFVKVKTKAYFLPRNILGGFILGLVNFFAVFLFTYSMINYDGSYFFPIFNSGVVAGSALMGFMFFKERLTKINLIGLLLATIAIITMNL